MVLMLLALALPTAALANSFKIFTTGDFVSGSASFGAGHSFEISLVGTENTITLFTPETTGGPFDFLFSTGTVTVKNPAGATVFDNSVTKGTISLTFPPGDFDVFADLVPNATVKSGDTSLSLPFCIPPDCGGGASVRANFVPEPSALEGLSLGTGLIGLAGMTRRKLRLGA
jgi:hypothetical protein